MLSGLSFFSGCHIKRKKRRTLYGVQRFFNSFRGNPFPNDGPVVKPLSSFIRWPYPACP